MAQEVLLVEAVAPLTRKVRKDHVYVDPQTKQKKTLTTERTLFRFRVLERLAAPQFKGLSPGKIIEVIDSNALLGESVHVSMVTTGTWPIPFMPQLEGQTAPVTGKRFVLLLASYETEARCYRGLGGLGVLPPSRQPEVRRLVKMIKALSEANQPHRP